MGKVEDREGAVFPADPGLGFLGDSNFNLLGTKGPQEFRIDLNLEGSIPEELREAFPENRGVGVSSSEKFPDLYEVLGVFCGEVYFLGV